MSNCYKYVDREKLATQIWDEAQTYSHNEVLARLSLAQRRATALRQQVASLNEAMAFLREQKETLEEELFANETICDALEDRRFHFENAPIMLRPHGRPRKFTQSPNEQSQNLPKSKSKNSKKAGRTKELAISNEGLANLIGGLSIEDAKKLRQQLSAALS